MSRHRFVRNIHLATAGEDDYEALSDGGEDAEVSPEDLAQMNSIRDHVRAVIGGAKKSGITDKEIDNASWEYYFDLDQTMDHILEVQGKRNAAKERQDTPETPEIPNERTTPSMPLSALQRLSLANKSPTSLASLAKGAQKQDMSGVAPPLSRLASLARTAPSPSPPPASSGASPTRSTQITPPKTPSKLASLAASGKAVMAASPPVSSPTSPSLSKLAQRINASRQVASPPAVSPPPAEITVFIDPLFLLSSKDVETLKAKKPSAFGAVLALPPYLGYTQNNKKVADIAVKKAVGSDAFTFNTPSPDDIVLNARRGTSLASRVR